MVVRGWGKGKWGVTSKEYGVSFGVMNKFWN